MGLIGALDPSEAILEKCLDWLWNRPRPCQHQCPIVLVHEPKRMHELVHGHNQPSVEAAGVHVEQLLPAPHTHLARAGWTAVYGHKIAAGAVGWHKGDAGGQLGDVVHRLPHPCHQVTRIYSGYI